MLKKILVATIIGLQISNLFGPKLALAQMPSCSLNSISPSSIGTNVSTNVTFNVSNNLNYGVNWVKLTSASDKYTLSGPTASGWSGTVNSNTEVSYSGGSLSHGSGGDFSIVVQSGSEEMSEQWRAYMSQNSDGSGAVECANAPTLSVVGSTTQPEISNLTASEIGTTSVKISWTTNVVTTGKIKYGTSESYGSESTTGSSTSHSVTLSGLTVYTLYHFRVEATDGDGNQTATADNNFTTAKDGSSSSSSTSTSSTVSFSTSTKVTPTPTPIPDTTPPAVKVVTDFSKPFKLPPKVAGTVSDNKSVSSVSFSLDGGKNWLPIEKLTGLNTKFVKFEFTPAAREDGDYNIQVRAVDPSKNTGFSKPSVLIIDRLPPKVGSLVMSMGPQRLESAPGNVLSVIAGVNQKVVISAVGGATFIELISQKQDLSDNPISYNLTKIIDSGLWSGTISFPSPGVYRLSSRSIDGARNQTEQNIGTVVVSDNGRVVSDGQNLIGVDLSVYIYQPSSQSFEKWDGASYGQTNPQLTTGEGKYQLYLPAGKYYLSLEKEGYKTTHTKIFTLDKSTPINSDFELKQELGFKLGPFSIYLPRLFNQTVELQLSGIRVDSSKNSLEGKLLPDFYLNYGDLPPVTNFTFRGKPYLLTFLNTWGPQSSQQLIDLEEIARDPRTGVVVIFPGQTQTTVDIFKKSGGYQLTMVADPDSLLTQPLNLYTLPTHLFISNQGVIKKLKTGLLTADEVITNLLN